MKVVYITAKAPYGKGESFILEEMLELVKLGNQIIVIPRNPSKKIFHNRAKQFLNNTIYTPLFNKKIILFFLKSLIFKPILWRIIFIVFKNSRNLKILYKNLAVIPKAIFISEILKKEKVKHIHAHWGSTTSTMAMIVSIILNISWSITLHRWDIKENNMLMIKIKLAKFVRCISYHGKKELLNIVGIKYNKKIKIIHMGVNVPKKILIKKTNKNFLKIVTPANLIEVKGHKYLIDACSILIKKNIKNIRFIFYGEGPLRVELENYIKKNCLSEYIKMPGVIPNEKLLEMYKNRDIDIVILPSIKTSNGEHEGIPVSLMEAMAYEIPVISTSTGGIPELIGNDYGIMIEEKNSLALANAIEKLIKDAKLRKNIGIKGREKIKKDFDIEENCKLLNELFK